MYFLIITAVAVTIFLWAILWPHSSLLYPIFRRGDRSLKQIALTFDDGPHPEYTPVVLDVLDEFGIKATFFCLGRQIDRYPELAAQIHQRGHLIGSHSYDHSFSFYFSGTRRTFDHILKAGKSIEAITGYFPRFYRPPVGIKTPPQTFAAGRLSLLMIGWSRRAFEGSYARLNAAKVKKLVSSVRNGDIVLLHDGRITPGGKELLLPGYKEELVKWLREFLRQTLDAGFKPVRVDELLREEAATTPPPKGLQVRSGLRTLYQSLLLENSDPKSIAISVALGVFLGCTPLFGLHTILGLLLAIKLRMNKAGVFAGTHISNPLFAPFVIYASVQLGWFLRHGHWLDLQFSRKGAKQLIHFADKLFFSWLAGSLVLGVTLALIFGSCAYLFFKSNRTKTA